MGMPSTGKGGQKSIKKQGQTSGRHASNPSASVKGNNKASDLSIKSTNG